MHHFRISLAALACLAAVMGGWGEAPAVAASGPAAREDAPKMDPAAIRAIMREKAQGGSLDDMYAYGMVLMTPRLGEPDLVEAERWLSRVAAFDVHSAEEALDVIRAYRSPDMRSPGGQYLLGLATYYGLQPATGESELAWMLLAAAGGEPRALEHMAGIALSAEAKALLKREALVSAERLGLALTASDVDRVMRVDRTLRRARAIFRVSYSVLRVTHAEMPSVKARRSEAMVAGFRARAEQGDVEAQMNLASAYDKGDSFAPEDPREAVRWYMAAADQRNHAAWGYDAVLRRLGELHESGRGVPRSVAVATTWYERAAVLGDLDSMVRLGRLHTQGIGCAPNLPEGARWMKRAAEAGDSPAAYFYARMAEYGIGVPADPIEAYVWAAIAKEADFDPAKKRLLKLRDKLTPAQLAEAKRRLAATRKRGKP